MQNVDKARIQNCVFIDLRCQLSRLIFIVLDAWYAWLDAWYAWYTWLDMQVGKMEVAELKMVRWALGVTRKDKIRNEYVRGTAKIAKLGDKLRNARIRWYGHVKRREEGYVGKTMMEMAVPGRRKTGRPRRRWMDLARENMERVGAKEGDEVDREK